METEILPVVCRIAGGFVTHLLAQSVLANRETLRQIVRGEFTENTIRPQEAFGRLEPMPGPLYTLARARLDWNRFGNDVYIDTVDILTRHVFFGSSGQTLTLRNATDIVANDVGVDFSVADPVAVRLEQGVLDTNAEAQLQRAPTMVGSAANAFASSSDWVTLTSADTSQLASLRFSDDDRRRIAQDLAGGAAHRRAQGAGARRRGGLRRLVADRSGDRPDARRRQQRLGTGHGRVRARARRRVRGLSVRVSAMQVRAWRARHDAGHRWKLCSRRAGRLPDPACSTISSRRCGGSQSVSRHRVQRGRGRRASRDIRRRVSRRRSGQDRAVVDRGEAPAAPARRPRGRARRPGAERGDRAAAVDLAAAAAEAAVPAAPEVREPDAVGVQARGSRLAKRSRHAARRPSCRPHLRKDRTAAIRSDAISSPRIPTARRRRRWVDPSCSRAPIRRPRRPTTRDGRWA